MKLVDIVELWAIEKNLWHDKNICADSYIDIANCPPNQRDLPDNIVTLWEDGSVWTDDHTQLRPADPEFFTKLEVIIKLPQTND